MVGFLFFNFVCGRREAFPLAVSGWWMLSPRWDMHASICTRAVITVEYENSEHAQLFPP